MQPDITQFTPKNIKALSYTDFVGLINQWNVPPGALSTISKWLVYSRVNPGSRLLEMACTTGFSSRELAKAGKCSAIGVDISATSVAAAQQNKEQHAADLKIEYEVADAYTYTPPQNPTHIILGAALKFFPDPERLIKRAVSLFTDEGYMLACPFYIQQPIPQDTIRQFHSIFGITPTTEGYKDVMTLYKGLEIIYQDHMEIHEETDSEIQHYCESTISRRLAEDGIKDEAIFAACYERLFEIKRMSNLLRPYQKYTTLVLRYTKGLYPQRYIELF